MPAFQLLDRASGTLMRRWQLASQGRCGDIHGLLPRCCGIVFEDYSRGGSSRSIPLADIRRGRRRMSCPNCFGNASTHRRQSGCHGRTRQRRRKDMQACAGSRDLPPTRGVALLPASARNFVPRSAICCPLKGEVLTIDVAVGYHKANTSPILKRFLSRIGDRRSSSSANCR
jgi:hypothetical protein